MAGKHPQTPQLRLLSLLSLSLLMLCALHVCNAQHYYHQHWMMLKDVDLSGKVDADRRSSKNIDGQILVSARRVLIGSSPPTCKSKCGRCSPCTAVHVPIQPGVSMPLEYYPEAWRCKCGNNLYMP